MPQPGGGNPGGGNPGGGNPGGGLITIDGANNVDDVLIGTVEDELIRGLSGNDFLDGRGGDDVLQGGKGNDELLGGTGSDSLDGGDDDDLLEGGAGGDIIDGGKGNDTATYRSSPSGVQVSLLVSVQSGGDAAGDVLTNIENLEGSAFDDTLEGDDQANRLAGLAGNDLLDGGAGNDTLEGGSGDDTLIGGEGADTFIHSGSGDGLDTIVDFDPTVDRIVLEGRAADYTWDETTGALVHATSGHGIIFADPTTRPDAYAFTGSEIIFSGGGVLRSSDTAIGGSNGDDLLIYFGTSTNVVLDGLGGDDRIIDLSPGAILRGDFDTQIGNDILEGRDGDTRFIGGLGDSQL